MFKSLFFLLFGVPLFAQEVRDSVNKLKSPIGFSHEVKLLCLCSMEAQFPGGPKALHSFIQNQLNIPNKITSSLNSSKVYVSFTVTVEGLIEDIKIEKGIHPEIDQSVFNIIKSMPTWTPYQLGCEYKPTRVLIPVLIDIL